MYASVTDGGVTVDSNSGSEADLRTSLGTEPTPEPKADTTPIAADDADDDGDSGDASPAPAASASDAAKQLAGRKRSLQARIDEITREKHDSARERDQARAEAAELRRQLDAAKAPARTESKPAVGDASDPEPNAADATKYPGGEYDPKYLKDSAKWEARQEFKAQQQQERESAQRTQREQATQQRVSTYVERFTTKAGGEKQAKAFAETLRPELANLQPSFHLSPTDRPTGATAIADVIVDSDNPIALLQHFNDHPDDFQRLSTLHPATVFREMGKLEARLDAASTSGPATTTPPKSAAIPPIKPERGSPHVADTEPTDDDSDDEWLRREQSRSKRK